MQDRIRSQQAVAESGQQALQFARARDAWSEQVQQQCQEKCDRRVHHLEDQLADTRAELGARQLQLRLLTDQRDEALRHVRRLRAELATVRDRRAPGNEPVLLRTRITN